ncbi:DUF4347 domain-containing protein [Microcystis aeruginosa]|uniref:DUF4347 domain-containing protein n=1 Tax=Microcystis aeruginosa TaxID=1126 RepID=UPI003A0FDAAD
MNSARNQGLTAPELNTGAKIAASSGRVGNASLTGSWELEVSFPVTKGENKTFVETLAKM